MRRVRFLAWVVLVACSSPVAAQARLDRVHLSDARGLPSTVSGTVTEDSLAQVVVETGSSTRRLLSASIERIDFGEVPRAFADARLCLERGDLANAAAKFSLAAGSGEARAVVAAQARLRAAESWLSEGLRIEEARARALEECRRYLSEFPGARDVPRARDLLGRLQLLSRDSAAAAETFTALFRAASGATPATGYPPLLSFEAGLQAAEARLAAGQPGGAREVQRELESAIGGALTGLPDGDPRRARYSAIQSETRLGEGFCLLAEGHLARARAFFQSQLALAVEQPARRFGAELGLAETLLAEGDAGGARLEFAEVSALDHTDEGRVARALVGLAESALALAYPVAKADARAWLETVREDHPGTPALVRALELLENL